MEQDKKVLIDTSAWVEFFRGSSTTASKAQRIIEDGRACVCGVIYFELLQGVRTDAHRDRLIDLLSALTFLEAPADIWIKAGSISARLRAKGITLPMSDILIGAVAIEHGHYVLTTDEHFSSIPGIKLYR